MYTNLDPPAAPTTAYPRQLRRSLGLRSSCSSSSSGAAAAAAVLEKESKLVYHHFASLSLWLVLTRPPSGKEGRSKEGTHSGTKVLSTSGKGGHCAKKRGSTSKKKMEPAAAAVNPPRDGESGISGALKSLGRLTHHHPKVLQVAGSFDFGPKMIKNCIKNELSIDLKL